MSTDQYTTGKLGLIEPGSGNYVDVWDTPLYANWQTLDAAVSGTTTITLTNLNVYLVVPTFPTYPNPPSTSLSAQNLRLLLNGTLSANVSVYIPSGVGGFWIIDNQTTGSFTVTILTTASGSTGTVAPQSKTLVVFSDGANVRLADSGNIPQVATPTVYGLVTQGLLTGNCVNLDAQAKIPYQTDKYIISTGTPDPAQGYQDWLWFQVSS